MQSPRVVSLIASSTEIVCALGLEQLLVGRSHECDFPLTVKSLSPCTSFKFTPDGTSYQIDQKIKAILQEGLSVYRVDSALLDQMRPDVILTQTQCEVCAVSEKDVIEAVCTLISSKPEIVSLQTNCLEDLWVDIRKVALALQAKDKGDQLVSELQAKLSQISKITAVLSSQTKSPRVACIEWVDPLMSAGNWMPELIELAGGISLFGEKGRHSPFLDWEKILTSDPDIILILPCGFDLNRSLEEIPLLHSKPGWRELKAFKTNQIFVLDGNQYFNRPGPRLVDSLEILAWIFHGQNFAKALQRSCPTHLHLENPYLGKAYLQLRKLQSSQMIAGLHYDFTQDGLLEMSRRNHLERGYCCHSHCKNCPYGFS